MFFFERTNRICQSNFASQDLLRELLQHTEALLKPSTTDDQLADQVQQALESITADTDDFAVFAAGFSGLGLLRLGLGFLLDNRGFGSRLDGRCLGDRLNGRRHLLQLLEPFHRRSKSLPDGSRQGRIAAHQQAHDIHRSQEHVGMTRLYLDAAFTHRAHEIFNIVGQIADRLESDGIGRALERVRRAKQLIDQVRVLGFLLEPQQLRFQGLSRYSCASGAKYDRTSGSSCGIRYSSVNEGPAGVAEAVSDGGSSTAVATLAAGGSGASAGADAGTPTGCPCSICCIVWVMPGTSCRNWSSLPSSRFIKSLITPTASPIVESSADDIEILSVPHGDHAGLNRMRNIADHLESDGVGRTFERMGGAIERLDRFGIAGIFSQAIGQHVQRLEIFVGLRREIGQHFSIDCGNQILRRQSFHPIRRGGGW